MCLNIILPSLLIINVSGEPKTPNSRAILPSVSIPTNEYGLPSSLKYCFESLDYPYEKFQEEKHLDDILILKINNVLLCKEYTKMQKIYKSIFF